jgi:hypothetical protein
MSYDEALAAFEAEPQVRVLLEQGAADGFDPGAPVARTVLEYDQWPVPDAVATTWSLDGNGAIVLSSLHRHRNCPESINQPEPVREKFWVYRVAVKIIWNVNPGAGLEEIGSS